MAADKPFTYPPSIRTKWDEIKYCAAREIWPYRRTLTPRPLGKKKTFVTWEQWWTDKFGEGETYEQFIERMKKDGAKKDTGF